MVREGLAALLRGLLPDVSVSEAGDMKKPCRRCSGKFLRWSSSISVCRASAAQLTRRLRQRLPQLRVLFFSLHDELALVRQALDAGARGYVTARAALTVLRRYGERLAGQLYLSSRWPRAWPASRKSRAGSVARG